jgi:hypothetical protein
VSSQWPARYEIRVRGGLGDRWSGWFEGLEVTEQGDETLIAGTLPDQPALHGVLDRIRDLGLSITSVQRLTTEGG